MFWGEKDKIEEAIAESAELAKMSGYMGYRQRLRLKKIEVFLNAFQLIQVVWLSCI